MVGNLIFVATKLAVWLVYPLSLGAALLLAAYLSGLFNRKRLFHLLFWMGFGVLYLASIEPVADRLIKPLQGTEPSPLASSLKADAIVVLGGDLKKKPFPTSDVEVAGNRTLKAARLFKQKVAPVIVVSGGSGDLFDPDFKEADLMKALLVELGVPGGKILVETRSRNTRENALYAKEELDRVGAKKIILVTSAFHVPRAQALFRRLGIEVVPAPSDYFTIDRKFNPFSFIPDTGSLERSQLAVKEYVAMTFYRAMGWI
jgi:uncharacterized SAM-binding protein YcdF (DUF218 family)